MKIGGVDPKTLSKEEVLVLPRGDQVIVFRAVGVSDYDEFNALCPEPKVPTKLMASGAQQPDEDNKDYKSILSVYNAKRLAWLVIRSLEPSIIEWDTVELGKPATWKNWTEDMKKSGLSQVECNRVTQLVFQANCLDEEKLKQARELFLRGRGPVQAESSGPSTEPKSTPSGEPASK